MKTIFKALVAIALVVPLAGCFGAHSYGPTGFGTPSYPAAYYPDEGRGWRRHHRGHRGW